MSVPLVALVTAHRPPAAVTQYPVELYQPSPRSFRDLQEPGHSFHERTITVTQCGRLCMGRRQKIKLSTVFSGQRVGVKQIKIWLVTFMAYDSDTDLDVTEESIRRRLH